MVSNRFNLFIVALVLLPTIVVAGGDGKGNGKGIREACKSLPSGLMFVVDEQEERTMSRAQLEDSGLMRAPSENGPMRRQYILLKQLIREFPGQKIIELGSCGGKKMRMKFEELTMDKHRVYMLEENKDGDLKLMLYSGRQDKVLLRRVRIVNFSSG